MRSPKIAKKQTIFVTAALMLYLLPIRGFSRLSENNTVFSPSPAMETQKLVFKTDLQVLQIHASRCDKSRDTEETFYMSNLMVDVANRKAGKVGAPAVAILTVTYYDSGKNRPVTIRRELPKLNPSPMEPWTIKQYVVSMTPVMIKKTDGITARIKAKSPSIEDPFPENDQITVFECKTLVD